MALTFQDMISTLQSYWQKQGCILWLPYHEAVGAGTWNPATALKVLGPEPWNVVYVEPSFRPDDGRFAENPNRVQMHHQLQVILKPAPADPLGLYLDSLRAIGLDPLKHDVRFVEDNWESPALGAWGLGWEIWLEAMEITQFTYFQSASGKPLDPPAVEITYGLERLAMYLQDKQTLWDLQWNDSLTYADVLKRQEIEFCEYDFKVADTDLMRQQYQGYLAEAKRCVEAGLVVPAHDYVLKCSHTFNILDARGAVGLAERVKSFGEMRTVSRNVGEAYLKQREALEFPLTRLLHKKTVAAESSPAIVNKQAAVRKDGTAPLTLEIGVEELAADQVLPLLEAFERSVTECLKDNRLSHGAVVGYATPRRLIVSVDGVVLKQPARVVEVRGPKKEVCDKNPKALEGFCKKNNISADQVTYEAVDGTTYATVRINDSGQYTIDTLAALLPTVLSSLKASKNMRWLASAEFGDAATVIFNRPVRWIVALLGEAIVPFVWAGVASGSTSIGGRFSGSQKIAIQDATSLVAQLSKAGVIADHRARREAIKQALVAAASKQGGTAIIADDLLNEVTQLVEHPRVIVGAIAPEFYEIYPIVLESTMAKHLRYFPFLSAHQEHTHFLAICNGSDQDEAIIRKGYERVLGARLADARYFLAQDKHSKLSDLRERTKLLTFVAKLGSMFDKSERLEKVLPRVAALLGSNVAADHMARAAYLAKCDLSSEMVVEMSSLQGEIGRLYAQRDGEHSAVAEALREQYLPTASGGTVPKTPLGIVLSISDRLDTLVALFSIGAEPTGSADAYGLRREALGLLHTILNNNIAVDLRPLLAIAREVLGVADKQLEVRVEDFLTKRLEVILQGEGLRYDAVRAVLARHGAHPCKARQQARSLDNILKAPSATEMFEAILRCVKVLRHAREKGVVLNAASRAQIAGVTPGIETELLTFADSLPQGDDLNSSFAALGRGLATVHRFFSEVMVMDPDPAISQRRLAIVQRVVASFESAADLLELEGFAN